MTTETQFLEAKVRGLENENRALRESLWDGYFKAAVTGLLAMGNTTTSAAALGANTADEMIAIRKERWS